MAGEEEDCGIYGEDWGGRYFHERLRSEGVGLEIGSWVLRLKGFVLR